MDTKTASPTYSSMTDSSLIRSGRIVSAALGIGGSLLIALASPGIATGQTPSRASFNIEHAEVRYADLNLSTRQGAEKLLSRIEHAAKEACGELVHSALLPRASHHHRTCVADAVDGAVAHVNAPLVAALHSGKPDVSLAAR